MAFRPPLVGGFLSARGGAVFTDARRFGGCTQEAKKLVQNFVQFDDKKTSQNVLTNRQNVLYYNQKEERRTKQ